MVTVRKYSKADIPQMIEIWNAVVNEGNAFPQTETLDAAGGEEFFSQQSYCGVAEENGEIAGMYILHPNNVGRCGHISNASYAVRADVRGKGVGKALVEDCMNRARDCGFRILQFNAVVSTNTAARRLYEKLGFQPLGVIKGGFLNKDGVYEDIVPYYIQLTIGDLQ